MNRMFRTGTTNSTYLVLTKHCFKRFINSTTILLNILTFFFAVNQMKFLLVPLITRNGGRGTLHV